MKDTLKIKVERLENVLEALFEQAEHEAQSKDADALIDVVKDIQETMTEIKLLKELIK